LDLYCLHPNQRLRRCLVAWALAGLCAPAVRAAAPSTTIAATGTLHGIARRADGSAVAGATVTATPERGHGAPSAATTAADGSFTIAVVPGTYLVTAELEGVTSALQEVTVGAATSELTLVIDERALRESITVLGDGYAAGETRTATRTSTPLVQVPQSVSVVTRALVQDQLMSSIGDVVRYVPGMTLIQGENNRDQLSIRGNSTSADFYLDGIRDDVQYYRDLYDVERIEALKGPNALVFGRGGGGGVVNRVTKEAGFAPLREIDAQGGSYGNARLAADVNQPLGDHFALRVNGVHEDSDSFRDGVTLGRSGVAPTLTWSPDEDTRVVVGYEHFRDRRVADRGITSYLGRPADVPVETYYGNPDDSRVRALVELGWLGIERRLGNLSLRNRTLYGGYDRAYQNYVPGAADATATTVAISAYNNATRRQNVFNQTDLTLSLDTGRVHHAVLVGMDLGLQQSDNFRNTGYFDNVATSIAAPFDDPRVTTPVTYRQSATDADNHVEAQVGALLAEDQVQLTPWLRVIGGLRVDRFDMAYRNHRNDQRLSRVDDLLSPRLGVVLQPTAASSIYASYGVSYLPSSGDQFSSLTDVTAQLEPEKFTNLELGAKWDVGSGLALTAAVYRLDRTNTRSTDPNDPTRIVQTGSQRTGGVELGASGQVTSRWSVAGAYAYQDATVTSATASAAEGATVGQVPRHTFSLWNRVRLSDRLAAAIGLVGRSAMFAAIDDRVTLPGYARWDAAFYVNVTASVRVQVNVENLLDRVYYANADNNTNISPGSPRAVRIGISAAF